MLTFAWIYEDTFWLWRSIFKSKAGESKIVLAKILVESRSVLLGKGEGAVQQTTLFSVYVYVYVCSCYLYFLLICISPHICLCCWPCLSGQAAEHIKRERKGQLWERGALYFHREPFRRPRNDDHIFAKVNPLLQREAVTNQSRLFFQLLHFCAALLLASNLSHKLSKTLHCQKCHISTYCTWNQYIPEDPDQRWKR